jgi:hypothetical protein
MPNHARDVVGAVAPPLALNEAALKQVAVLFDRIALPSLAAVLAVPTPPQYSKFTEHLVWLAEADILFEPVVKPSADQNFKDRLFQDIDDLYKPVGVSAEDLLAARKDEKKAIEVKTKTREFGPALASGAADPAAVFMAIQRMIVNTTRRVAIDLRNLDHLDAHAVVSSEFSSFEQDDEHPNKEDVVKIGVAALPLPDPDVSWQQIIEYRNDPNSLNRFIDLRNWIRDTALGKLTPNEVEESLAAVLKRFHKQMEFHRMKTVATAFEAFVTTPSDVLRNLFRDSGSMILNGICSLERRQLGLLEGESLSEGSVVAYVLGTNCLSSY